VTANSLYGQVGARTSAISFKEIAACTTACGRGLIYKSKEFAETNYEGCQTVYGDSVTGDTPLLLKDRDGKISIKTIENLSEEWVPYEAFKVNDTRIEKKQQARTSYQVWSDKGWTNIIRVIRHMTNKKIYRVNSSKGCIDVTEDHSLIDTKYNMIKPKDCHHDTNLLYSFPTEFPESHIDLPTETDTWLLGQFMAKKDENKEFTIPDVILNTPIQLRKSFINGYLGHKETDKKDHISIEYPNKIGASGLYYLCKSIGYDDLNIRYVENNYIITNNPDNDIRLTKNELSMTDQYVYDLETSLGRFQAGVGESIVSNTDSVEQE
jgi:hypothetical protein